MLSILHGKSCCTFWALASTYFIIREVFLASPWNLGIALIVWSKIVFLIFVLQIQAVSYRFCNSLHFPRHHCSKVERYSNQSKVFKSIICHKYSKLFIEIIPLSVFCTMREKSLKWFPDLNLIFFFFLIILVFLVL